MSTLVCGTLPVNCCTTHFGVYEIKSQPKYTPTVSIRFFSDKTKTVSLIFQLEKYQVFGENYFDFILRMILISCYVTVRQLLYNTILDFKLNSEYTSNEYFSLYVIFILKNRMFCKYYFTLYVFCIILNILQINSNLIKLIG